MSNSLVFVSLNYSLFPNHYLSTFPAHLRKNFHRASSIAFVKPVALKVPTKQKFYWHIDILLNFIISCIPINAKSLTKSFYNKKRTRSNYDFIEKNKSNSCSVNMSVRSGAAVVMCRKFSINICPCI